MEAEWHLNAELFLDEYPRWEIDGPQWSIILHDMFLHTAEQGRKEAKRFIQWGCWQSLPRPDPEPDVPTIKRVGYQTSHKEIRGPLPLMDRGGNLRHSILSVEPVTWVGATPLLPKEDLQGAAVAIPPPIHLHESWSRSRRDPHSEASPGGQRVSSVGAGSHPHIGAWYWEAKQGVEDAPIHAPAAAVEATPRASPWTGAQGPQAGIGQRGRWLFGNWKYSLM